MQTEQNFSFCVRKSHTAVHQHAMEPRRPACARSNGTTIVNRRVMPRTIQCNGNGDGTCLHGFNNSTNAPSVGEAQVTVQCVQQIDLEYAVARTLRQLYAVLREVLTAWRPPTVANSVPT